MKANFLFTITLITIMCACKSNYDQNQTRSAVDLYVGTYTGEGSEGIYRLQFHPKSGELSGLELIAKTSNPSYLALSDSGKYLFSVSEDESGRLAAWSWGEDGKLKQVSEVSTYGKHPCHLDIVDGLVAVANYSSGNGGVFTFSENGNLSRGMSEFQHYGSSENKERQSEPHTHYSKFYRNGELLYVVDLGIDQVLAYPVQQGKLGGAFTALTLEKGDGPRHLEFHPSRNLVYIVTELSNQVIAASIDQATGKFELIDRKRTLPEAFDGESFCADVHVSPDGKYVYVSNRGHQSIAMFKVLEDGALELLGTEDVRGDWPRNFVISRDGKFLLVANQNSDNITVFQRDVKTGLLEFTGHELEVSHPVCLKF